MFINDFFCASDFLYVFWSTYFEARRQKFNEQYWVKLENTFVEYNLKGLYTGTWNICFSREMNIFNNSLAFSDLYVVYRTFMTLVSSIISEWQLIVLTLWYASSLIANRNQSKTLSLFPTKMSRWPRISSRQ